MFQSLLTCVLTALLTSDYCLAAVPTITDNWFNTNYPDFIPDTDITDPRPFVEPTVPSGEGEVITSDITPINNMVTDNGVKQSKPKAKGETSQEVLNWLQTLRDLETKKHVMGIKNRDGQTAITSTESMPGMNGEDIELPSPDKFFKWLDSIPPLEKDTSQLRGKSKPEKDHVDKLDTSVHHSVHELDMNVFNSKLIIMICVPVGVVLFFLILLTIYIVYKTRVSDKKVAESKLTVLGRVNRNPDVFNVEGKDSVFMGIPTNNQIWKELQMLPSTAPSVLPESKTV